MALLVTIDGMRATGKTSVIRSLQTKLHGCKVMKFPAPQGDVVRDAYAKQMNWFKGMHSLLVSIQPRDVIIFDRGLGTEFLYCTTRGHGIPYQMTIAWINAMVAKEFTSRGHHWIEIVLTNDGVETQLKRGRKPEDLCVDVDTMENWLWWMNHAWQAGPVAHFHTENTSVEDLSYRIASLLECSLP